MEEVNRNQKYVLLEKIRSHFNGDISGKNFAVWGLSFKPHTDDIREAPAIEIIRELVSGGATVKAFDPVAMDNARRLFEGNPGVSFAEDSYGALPGANALILVTEWPQFRKPDFDQIRTLLKEPVIFDGRNQYNPDLLKKQGFNYYGIGRNS